VSDHPAAPATLLSWDTAFFGRAIARSNLERLTPDSARELMAWCGENHIECLYLLADPADAQTTRLAEANAFSLVDIRLTLATALDRAPAASRPAERFDIGPVWPAEVPAVRRIARISHTDSRFFYDPGFSPERAADLYDIWIEQSCQRETGVVLVAREAGEPIGYLACDRATADTGAIVLIATAPGHQGRGVAQALLAAGHGWFQRQGFTTARVVTQGRNIRALRLYERAGYLATRVQLWYHRWFPAAIEERLT
jgi:dTDP-4-amino-4,6-dideoxy-D-galactose acyltransferase